MPGVRGHVGLTGKKILAAHDANPTIGGRALARMLRISENAVASCLNRNRSGWNQARVAALRPMSARMPPVKQCQFPFGHVGEPNFRFCGAEAVPGRSYCAACCLIAYKPREGGI